MLRAVVHNGVLVTVGGKILTINAINNFIENLSSMGYTFGEAILRDSFESLPIKPTTGISLFPYAYKSGAIAMMSNATGSVIDASFSRSGAGWAMQNGNIVQLGNNLPRWDEFYYKDEIGYLVEESDTNFLPNGYSTDWRFDYNASATSLSLNQDVNGFPMSLLSTNSLDVTSAGAAVTSNTSGPPNTVSFFFKVIKLDGLNLIFQWPSDNSNIIIIRLNEQSEPYIVSNTGFTTIKDFRKYRDGIYYIQFQRTSGVGARRISIILSGANFLTNQAEVYFSYFNKSASLSSGASFIATAISSTRPAESLQIPITATTDIWMKTDQGEQLIEAVPSGSFNVHDYITNGKLISLLAPMRQFTPEERSVLNV